MVKETSDKENGCNEPETAAGDTTCADPGEGQGELDDNLIVVVYDSAFTQQLGSMSLKAWNTQGEAARKVIGTIGAGESKDVIVQVAGYEARDVLVKSGVDDGAWIVALGTQKLDTAQKVKVVDKLRF